MPNTRSVASTACSACAEHSPQHQQKQVGSTVRILVRYIHVFQPGAKTTGVTEDMLLKWNPAMDKWADLLHGESKEHFLSFRAEYMKLVQEQQELFHRVRVVEVDAAVPSHILLQQPVKRIDWSKYEGIISADIIADIKKHIAGTAAI